MSPDVVERLVDTWMTDEEFRHQVRSRPKAALADLGIVLEDDELAAVQSLDWSMSDDELESRVTNQSPRASGC